MFIKIHNSVIKGVCALGGGGAERVTVPLGKVAKPQALTEGVSYYNMYYFSRLFQQFVQF
jgi:hypothetical protein